MIAYFNQTLVTVLKIFSRRFYRTQICVYYVIVLDNITCVDTILISDIIYNFYTLHT